MVRWLSTLKRCDDCGELSVPITQRDPLPKPELFDYKSTQEHTKNLKKWLKNEQVQYVLVETKPCRMCGVAE